MNLLLVESLSSDSISILGKEAHELLTKHSFTVGNIINVGVRNGPVAKAEIIGLSSERISLRLHCKLSEKIAQIKVSLLVALPRPQTLKKVFEFAGSVGLENIYLITSERVEKSYFNSRVLHEDEQRKYLELGMSQGVSTQMPNVKVLDSFKRGLSVIKNKHPNANFLLAHPYSGINISELKFNYLQNEDESTEVILAIGPEAGWTEAEILEFEMNDYQSFKSGDKILRVEYAVCALVSQVKLLHEINYKK